MPRDGGGVLLHHVRDGAGCVVDISQVLSGKIYTVLSVMHSFDDIVSQVHSNGSRGDFADSFAFSTLFPNVLQVRRGLMNT